MDEPIYEEVKRLKKELARVTQERDLLKKDTFEYIEVFDNRERFHAANDYLSPVDYEIQQKAL